MADGTADGRGLQPRRHAASSATGKLDAHRQPDQPGDGDHAAQGDLPQPRTARSGPTSSSRRACSLDHAQGRAGGAGGGGAARAAGHLRLRRRRRQDGRPRGRSRSSSIEGDVAIIRKGLAPGEQVVVDGQNQLRPGARSRAGARRGAGAKAAATRPQGAGAGGRGAAVSISEPFIRRPVATTLLMVGLAARGHRRLPRSCRSSALPQVDYPTIVVSTYLPGASAETMASAVTTPLERQFGQMPALTQMTSVVELRQLADHAAVHARPQHRRRRAGRAGGDQRGVEPAAAHAAGAADLQQEQPRRHADPHARRQLATRCRSARSTTTPTRSSRRRSRRSRASAW